MRNIDLLAARAERLTCPIRDNRQALIAEHRIPHFHLNVGKELIF
jgi:hypothetical protein